MKEIIFSLTFLACLFSKISFAQDFKFSNLGTEFEYQYDPATKAFLICASTKEKTILCEEYLLKDNPLLLVKEMVDVTKMYINKNQKYFFPSHSFMKELKNASPTITVTSTICSQKKTPPFSYLSEIKNELSTSNLATDTVKNLALGLMKRSLSDKIIEFYKETIQRKTYHFLTTQKLITKTSTPTASSTATLNYTTQTS